VFKGGSSLSKGYQIISRFSEDVDLTYDIRVLAPDLSGPGLDPLPATRSVSFRQACVGGSVQAVGESVDRFGDVNQWDEYLIGSFGDHGTFEKRDDAVVSCRCMFEHLQDF